MANLTKTIKYSDDGLPSHHMLTEQFIYGMLINVHRLTIAVVSSPAT